MVYNIQYKKGGDFTDYLKVWTSFAEVIEPLNDGEKGRLFVAMLEYAESEENVPDLKGNERYIWPVARQTIDRAREESKRLTANGSKGGRPRKSEQEKPTETNTNQQEPTETQKDNIKIKKDKENIKRFIPPTVEEVRSYCQERGNAVNAERFVDFYTAKGWKVGSNPMKDWKAAVRTWEGRDSTPVKKVSAQDYSQRPFDRSIIDADTAKLMQEAKML